MTPSEERRYTDRLKPLKYHPKQQALFDDTYSINYRFNVVHPGRRSGKCLASGTLIHLSDESFVPIEDVKIGDSVWSLNENNELEAKRVAGVFDNGMQDCVRLSASKFAIDCTVGHRFLSDDYGWSIANSLSMGEGLYVFDKDKIKVRFVKGRKEVGLKQTYDLSVEDNHNFIANGFVTHNSEIIGKRRFVARAVKGDGAPNPRYAICAPTRDQVKKIYWRDLKTLTLPFQDPGNPPRESDLIIFLKGDREIHLIGMDKPERIEGSHWSGIVLDEYANMKKETWEEHVRPALSTPGRPPGWCDFVGVPEGRNHFYHTAKFAQAQMIEFGEKSQWAVWHWPSSDILSPQEIADAMAEMDELTFQQEYGGAFLSFKGRAYYNFSDTLHCAKLSYNPKNDLCFCFDFNVDPGVAAVIQEQNLVDVKTQLPIIGTQCTGVIDEVWIPKNSNTEKVAKKLAETYGEHQGKVFLYGDASGGSRGSAKVRGSDWDLVDEVLKPVFGERLIKKVPLRNPPIRARINSVNSRLKNTLGAVRMQVDPIKAPHVVLDFEGVSLVEGSAGEIDKRSNLELSHLCFAAGTIVETDRGPISIEQLPKFGKIKTAVGFQSFINNGCRGKKEVIELVFDNGKSVVCTEDHLFLTLEGWKEACSLSDTILYNTQLINFKLEAEQTSKIMNRSEFAKIVERVSKNINIEKTSKSIVHKNVILRVKKIINRGAQEVYCPTVEVGHFLLFDQLVVSNSDSVGYMVQKEYPVVRKTDMVKKLIGF